MKRTQRKQRKQKVKNKVLYIAAALVFVFFVFVIYSSMLSPSQSEPNDAVESKAAIVDHLSIFQPNQTFWQTSKAILETAGFKVSYFGGGVVTVGFYRKLPSLGFQLIIFRVHSTASSIEESEPGDFVVFFTSERYSNTKYVTEQLAHQLCKTGFPYDSKQYFGITPLFVRDAMKGRFKNTTIIMMGCEGLKYTSMAEAFIDKGAEVYIGWDGPVSAAHTDQATMHLLKSLVTKKRTIGQALTEAMNEVGQDPAFESVLLYHPTNAGNVVISTSADQKAPQTNALVFTRRQPRSTACPG